MKEKLKVILALFLFLFFLPYVITVFIQGTTLKGGRLDESVTETMAGQGAEEEKVTNEKLVAILAKEINVNSEEEAIKAQAVIVRTNYAYAAATESAQEEGLSIQDMMTLFGEQNFSICYDRLVSALEKTKTTTISFGGNPVSLPYHAVSAGRTRDAKEASNETAFPYLIGVDSKMDIPSENYLKVEYFDKMEFLAQLEQIYQGVAFQENDVLSQLVIQGRDSAGYVTAISAGDITLSGEDFRKAFGINSANFTLAEVDGKIRVVTKGLGHGFGLSQYGAEEMAKEGKDYIEILKYYFPQIEITE